MQPFDPSNQCCASIAQKKKKSATSSTSGRPTNVQVAILPGFTPILPRGRSRTALIKSGRIKTLQFKRSLTALQVKNKIFQEFKGLEDLESWTVMENKSNHLAISKIQKPNGNDVINRKGSLYLCQKSKKVTAAWL